jgi:hypothetical protein
MQNNPTHKAKTISGDWIEGYFDGANVWCEGDDRYPYPIIETTLCRSTYRQDSNGKMMYDGDEVEVGEGITYTIMWNDYYCGFILQNDRGRTFINEVKLTLTGKNKHD